MTKHTQRIVEYVFLTPLRSCAVCLEIIRLFLLVQLNQALLSSIGLSHSSGHAYVDPIRSDLDSADMIDEGNRSEILDTQIAALSCTR